MSHILITLSLCDNVSPISSAGLLGLLLMNASKASFMELMKPSFRPKQVWATLSILSLKSSSSCTMSLSFSGVHTISPPNAWEHKSPRGMMKKRKHFLTLSVITAQCTCTGCSIMHIPWCSPSRNAAEWEVLPWPCWTAGREEPAQSHGAHPVECSDLRPRPTHTRATLEFMLESSKLKGKWRQRKLTVQTQSHKMNRDIYIPFCSIAVICSPKSCFSTQLIRGFLWEKTNTLKQP